ncbi:MAG: hypothetical protein JKY98_03940 [Gammaproteobacteria bacterium]|nr:hypothetical protein [Gammaproteobacteria bacterium]
MSEIKTLISKVDSMAKSQLKMAGDFSKFRNDQTTFNKRIDSYMDTDSKTGRKGLFEQTAKNSEDIVLLKQENKVSDGKKAVAIGIFVGIGAVLKWAVGLIF